MKNHLCRLCKECPQIYQQDIILAFANNLKFMIPDTLPHLVIAHQYWPEEKFVQTVLEQPLAKGIHNTGKIEPIGYIVGVSNPIDRLIKDNLTYETVFKFLTNLERLIRESIEKRMVSQRGVK